MRHLLLSIFTKLYGPVPSESQSFYYWVTAVIFFIPIVLSPLFFFSYWIQSGPGYALTYGLLMLLAVCVGLPLFFRLIMKLTSILYNEKDEPPKKP